MKIKLTDCARDVFTVNEYDSAKALQKAMREQKDLSFEAESLANLVTEYKHADILRIDAEIVKNRMVPWDYFCITDDSGAGSGSMDVWITVYAFCPFDGFYRVSGYLSDAWTIAPDTRDSVRRRVYAEKYTLQK